MRDTVVGVGKKETESIRTYELQTSNNIDPSHQIQDAFPGFVARLTV